MSKHTEAAQSGNPADIAQLMTTLRALHAGALALLRVPLIAQEAHQHWDADRDAKVGKILLALAGELPGYRADIDEIHAAVAQLVAAVDAQGSGTASPAPTPPAQPLVAELRNALEERAFHRGAGELAANEYCDFCGYSRQWIEANGHGEHCLLRRSSVPPPEQAATPPPRTFSFDGEGIYEMPPGLGQYVLNADYRKLQQRLAEWEKLRTDREAAHLACLRGMIALHADDALHVGGTSRAGLARFRQRAEAAEADAARYRYLRSGAEPFGIFMPREHGHIAFRGEALDNEVDKARIAAKPAEPPSAIDKARALVARVARTDLATEADVSVDKQLAEDQRRYGVAYARIEADGARTRIDPSTVTIAPPSPPPSPYCIFEDCDLDRAEGSQYCAGHIEELRQIDAEEAERRSRAKDEGANHG